MAFSYRPLWHTMIDKGVTAQQLREGAGLSREAIPRMKHGRCGRLEMLDRICGYLSCPIEAVIEHIPDPLPDVPQEDAQEVEQEEA